MPLWVLLDIKENGKIGIWYDPNPFPSRPGYTFKGSTVEGKSVGDALITLGKKFNEKDKGKK